MNQREHVIDLVNRLIDAREHLSALEAELEELLGTASTEVAPGGGTELRRARGSVSSRVLDLLTSDPAAAFTVPEIAGRLKTGNVNALRQAVIRLASLKRIERRSRGAYGAVAKGPSASPPRGARKREGWLSGLFE